MNTRKKIIHDPDLAKVEAALQRAGARAREIARKTHTPLIIYKDGKIRRHRVYNEDISCHSRKIWGRILILNYSIHTVNN